MSKQIYLDNAATTQMSDAVKQAMEPYLQENYGNASTAYSIGEDARRELEKLRAKNRFYSIQMLCRRMPRYHFP